MSDETLSAIVIKPAAEKSLARRHPWIFSGAVSRVEGAPGNGETVQVKSADGAVLAQAAYSPHSQIRARVWSSDPDAVIHPDFFAQRLQQALSLRRSVFGAELPDACRLVNAESDGLPGLVVDRYGDYLVCQFMSSGAEYWRGDLVRLLTDLLPVKGIYDRSDGDARNREGLDKTIGVQWGQEPPELIEITDPPYRFLVDIRDGHKTGFYLDQRENRRWVERYARGRRVLNCFSYTGGFGIAALLGGAESVINLDASARALDISREIARINPVDPKRLTIAEDNAFAALRRFRDAGHSFDMIILDPPKFADSRHQVDRAARGYKDINLLAVKLLAPGGILFTFSCSGGVSRELFQKIVADAALDARRDLSILHWLSQSADHPVSANFPEGSYLKGLICRAGQPY